MKSRKKILDGKVVSTKMEKTIVVKVERPKRHKLYQKRFKIYKNFKAHDEDKKASAGDRVRIIEAKPYSKDKHFALLEVVHKVTK